MELHIRDVSKTYSNGVQALKDVDLYTSVLAARYRPIYPEECLTPSSPQTHSIHSMLGCLRSRVNEL